MSKHSLPSTSIDAYKSITDSQLNEHYQKILFALSKLKAASAEQIADYVNMQHSQINRRVKELELKGLVWRPGGKVPTKTGRSAMLIQLSSDTEPLSPPVEKSDKKAKSVATYSKKIKELSTPFIQPSLF